jgi:uncharacterized protein YdhG (YjbR/CyaY superfamily)
MHAERDPVEAYIEHAPKPRREVLAALRRACREELDGFSEEIEYGMPSYSRDGEVVISFASQKQYISLYILRTDVIAAHRDQFDQLDLGKGCIRYRKPEDIDLDLVRSMLRQSARSDGPVC